MRKVLLLGALLSTILAFAASVVGVTRCSFLEARAELNDYDVGPKVGLGFYSFQLGGHCYEYPDGTDFGSSFRAARTTSVAAAVLGGASLLILLVATLFSPPRVVAMAVGWALLAAGICQGVTLMAFRSDACTTSKALELWGGNYLNLSVSCALSRGSRLSITAVAFWLLSSLLTVCLPEPGGDSTAQYTNLV